MFRDFHGRYTDGFLARGPDAPSTHSMVPLRRRVLVGAVTRILPEYRRASRGRNAVASGRPNPVIGKSGNQFGHGPGDNFG